MSPGTFAASADIFHERQFGMGTGLVLGGMGVESVLGPWLRGYLYDIFRRSQIHVCLLYDQRLFPHLVFVDCRSFELGYQ
jgi:hypothetical protein